MNIDGTHDSTIQKPMQAIAQIILGEPASKANSRRVVRFGSMSRLIESVAVNFAPETGRSEAMRVLVSTTVENRLASPTVEKYWSLIARLPKERMSIAWDLSGSQSAAEFCGERYSPMIRCRIDLVSLSHAAESL
jgi:hypothetical protein